MSKPQSFPSCEANSSYLPGSLRNRQVCDGWAGKEAGEEAGCLKSSFPSMGDGLLMISIHLAVDCYAIYQILITIYR
jgi:hypothetical protein